ncbi:hypothetical protein Ancab_039951 [Ancistrocladus abbreviatus]
MSNLTSLTSLALKDCELNGLFPKNIFLLPNLQFLDVGNNQDLVGSLPEFLNSSKLEALELMNTRFSGEIPNAISNLGSLRAFSISNARFQGLIPHTLGELNQLKYLDLSYNYFKGLIPDSLGNLSQLISLSLHTNQLTGQIPPSLANLTQLTLLELASNNFRAAIPAWISTLGNLTKLNLQTNSFIGAVEFSMFLELKQLVSLGISGVDLIMPYETHDDDTYPQFQNLELSACNLNHFPDFLRTQKNLQILYLEENDIQGPIPQWVWNMSRETLLHIDLANNALTSFGKHPNVLPWVNLQFFGLNGNKLQGSFPLPSPFLFVYKVDDNELSGQIPPLICNATSLFWPDLSYNNLRGVIPPCLSNLSSSLTFLSLQQNNLEGPIPARFTASCNLKMIDLSSNRLKGGIPRSLENCSSIWSLDLSHNLIEDVFPTWLGALPKLRVLLLGSNRLHGVIPVNDGFGFPKLRIIDLSNNGFVGELPNQVFLDWHAMEAKHQGNASYVEDIIIKTSSGIHWTVPLQYSILLTIKGRETKYDRLLNIFLFVDLSNNRFKGQIPESIGSLTGLQALNLSNNNLIGPISPSFANLLNHECLDLSRNMLAGEIPLQLTKLTFLEIFNVSYNHLVGTIPQANQFGTFPNDSFQGNTGLCGSPLSKQCKNSTEWIPSQAQASEEDEDSSSLVEWIIISMGYVAGLVTGVILGHIITTEKHEWFVKTFGKKQHNTARKR